MTATDAGLALAAPPCLGARPGNGSVVRSEDPAILAQVRLPEIELAIWQRPRACAAVDALAATDLARVEDLDQPFAVEGLAIALAEALDVCGYGATRCSLVEELAEPAGRFARIMTCDTLRIRLQLVEDDACKRFHRDHVSARLLLTLLGPATQWVDRSEASSAAIHQLATGDVAVVKGNRWSPDGTIQHRSPPIAGTGIQRLVVTIDALGPVAA